jgi:hypothetical protein
LLEIQLRRDQHLSTTASFYNSRAMIVRVAIALATTVALTASAIVYADVVWGSELVNTPVRALVTEDGEHGVVALLARAASAGPTAQEKFAADSWPGSRPQVYAAAHGPYRFKTRPPQLATWSGKSHGTLVALAADGTELMHWSRDLVNIPVLAYVANDGKHVVTFDTWAKLGYEHALVVYGEQGTVIVDCDLEALLSADEIATSVVHAVSARRWLQGATIMFDPSDSHIVINLSWGKIIRVALATGTIETAQ